MILYHGSKGGIKGKICPLSRDNCDFGRGFYVGESELQTKTLVCNAAYPVFYKIELNVDQLKPERIMRFNADETWLNYVLYNRGVYDRLKGTEFYTKLSNLSKGIDLIIGPIADDSFKAALLKFSHNNCSNLVLLDALSHNSLKQQYVAKTECGCNAFTIVDSRIPGLDEIKQLEEEQRRMIEYGNKVLHEAENRYWNKGKRLSDIINEAMENERKNR